MAPSFSCRRTSSLLNFWRSIPRPELLRHLCSSLPDSRSVALNFVPAKRVHSDVCGPIDSRTADGYRYFIIFLDNHSHMVAVSQMRTKDATLKCFKSYESMATSYFNQKISRLRCGNGSEYVAQDLKTLWYPKGNVLEYTMSCFPEFNGASERMIRTLAEKTRAMIIEANLPNYLWWW